MNFVVAMKQVPDLQQVRIRNRQPVFDDVPLTLGNIDKNALEAAVVLKDSLGGSVIALSAGNENVEDTIKEALAAGADEAFLVLDDKLDGADSSVIAQVLAAAIKKIDDVGLIIFGEGSGDNYSGQVGSRVAEILNLPQAGYAVDIKVEGNKAIVTRSLEDCQEVLEVSLPAVITVLSDINEARIPSVTQILKAGKKPKEVLELSDVDIKLPAASAVTTVSNLAPVSERKRVVVKSAAELVQVLTAEGVIGR
ncbi:electron transfer flavoprotein subunit beta/FixA family protein [Syntrophomonas palmitatica]|uniref:electron transfer flavoprotein subunit beta/FixA family protein n=1 Tax=Syntrophomonas palmitatica TaxID=402877 RepID=UPI0006D24A12|nr:electron transfer flavoprotein subunit beta/FixA family protein [Syntrophomonas palmitatica]